MARATMKKIKIKNPEEWVRDEYFDAESGDWQRYSYSEAMKLYAEYYHQENLREELQRYEIFKAVNLLNDCENMTYEEIIDNYLNSR